MGHINPPISDGIDTLFEVSSTYLARAKEIEIKLLERERSGNISSGDELKKFRTGELRSFIELCANKLGWNKNSSQGIIWEGAGLKEIGRRADNGEIVVRVDPKYFRPTEVD